MGGDLKRVNTRSGEGGAYSLGCGDASLAGLRLWETALPEIGPTAPVRVSSDDAVLVDLSGRVLRFGLADGAVRWERSVSSDVNREPAVGAGLVVVADRSGTVTALDAATGTSRWDRPFAATAVALAPDDAEGRVLLARALILGGRDREGDEELRRALETEPRNLPALTESARVAARRGDFGQAIEFWQRIIAAAPSSPAAAQARDAITNASRLSAVLEAADA